MSALNIPNFDDVRAARARIQAHLHQTPVLTCQYLDTLTGASLHFKCENFQKTGSFKARGACNAVFSLSEAEKSTGVVTHSSGNHGAALAYAAQRLGISATVVMPRTAVDSKKKAVQDYGATLVECDPTSSAREQTSLQLTQETNATFIHPFNDPNVIAGQGTFALELLDQVEGLDSLIVPIGGGGLTSGSAITLAGKSPRTQLFSAAPKNTDDAAKSLKAGKLVEVEAANTIADGLKMPLKELTWHFVSQHVNHVYTVSERDIVAAMKLIWQRMKIIIEPSCAVTLAAIINNPDAFKGQRIGVALTGGNVNLDRLPWLAQTQTDPYPQ